MPQRDQALLVGVEAREPDRAEGQPHFDDGNGCAGSGGKRDGLGRQCQRQRDQQRLEAVADAFVVMVVRVAIRVVLAFTGSIGGSQRLGLEAGAPNRLHRLRDDRLGRGDRQRARTELEVQGLDAGQGLQGTANLRLFDGAIHCLNAEDG